MMPIFSKLEPAQSRFYYFLILHSVLIGLFPFFIPVFLWRMDFSLAGISFYIAITGCSFCLALFAWDRQHQRLGPRLLFILSMLLELALLLTAFYAQYDWFILCFGLLSGCYSCTYWMTQRTLFLETITSNNSGDSFGNLQIVVLIALKIGMLCGGFLLERAGLLSVASVSILLVILGLIGIKMLTIDLQHFSKPEPDTAVTFKQWFRFKDKYHSRPVFLADGVFLFLESHFWLLSLFFIADENFTRLSILVIGLGLVFSILFWGTKKIIDQVTGNRLYQFTVLGYALSWVLRAALPGMSNTVFVINLVLITFLTSLFRLTFNKRFFDHALHSKPHHYLVCKSYLSQATLVLFFMLAGMAMLLRGGAPSTSLTLVYCLAVPLSATYWFYKARSSQVTA